MNGNITVIAERGSNGECGGERTTERINEHVNRLANVLVEHIVHIVLVKIVASYETFEVKMVVLHR